MIQIGQGEGALVAYNLEETAAMLKIHEKTVRDYIKRGDLLARKVGKRYYITQLALEKYITPQELQTETRINGG